MAAQRRLGPIHATLKAVVLGPDMNVRHVRVAHDLFAYGRELFSGHRAANLVENPVLMAVAPDDRRLQPGEWPVRKNELLLALGNQPQAVPARIGNVAHRLRDRGLAIGVITTVADRVHTRRFNATDHESHSVIAPDLLGRAPPAFTRG